MSKPRLYFLLAKQALLEPLSGDRINEIGLIRALSRHFDVYYNGVLADPSAERFGRADGIIAVPQLNEYDLVYVRANREVFLAAPPPKLWFASPYDAECFAVADAIVCMTQPWKDQLQTYSASKYEYFDRMYPIDMPAPSRCVLFPQVVKAVPSDEELSALRQKVVELPKVQQKKSLIKRFSGIFTPKGDVPDRSITMRHFGPIRATNYPHHLARALENRTFSERLTAECIGVGSKINLPSSFVIRPRIEQEKALALLAQTPVIWYHQQRAGNFAGSLKVLEAMAMGVPVLAPRWDARVCELGEDYPFFWSASATDSFANEGQDAFETALMKIATSTPADLHAVAVRLRSRIQVHTVDAVAKRLADELKAYL